MHHIGAWLQALPISSVGLRMDNDVIRMAVWARTCASLTHAHVVLQLMHEGYMAWHAREAQVVTLVMAYSLTSSGGQCSVRTFHLPKNLLV